MHWCNDLLWMPTENVIEEAFKRNCNLVLAHHPMNFFRAKKINSHDYTGRAVTAAIRREIAVYALHKTWIT
jgi:putative NIF3 family GTP cyclohydrolase 1 type 2